MVDAKQNRVLIGFRIFDSESRAEDNEQGNVDFLVAIKLHRIVNWNH